MFDGEEFSAALARRGRILLLLADPSASRGRRDGLPRGAGR